MRNSDLLNLSSASRSDVPEVSDYPATVHYRKQLEQINISEYEIGRYTSVTGAFLKVFVDAQRETTLALFRKLIQPTKYTLTFNDGNCENPKGNLQ